MRNFISTIVCISAVVFFASCGGSSSSSGGSSTAEQAAETSLDGFVAILNDDDVTPCLTGQRTTCDCPNGGTVTVDLNAGTMTLDGCTSSDDLVYTGELTTDDGETIDGTMTTFGECSNLTATNAQLDGCGGTASGTCGGETYTCNMTGADEDCDCA